MTVVCAFSVGRVTADLRFWTPGLVFAGIWSLHSFVAVSSVHTTGSIFKGGIAVGKYIRSTPASNEVFDIGEF